MFVYLYFHAILRFFVIFEQTVSRYLMGKLTAVFFRNRSVKGVQTVTCYYKVTID